jgi:Outer membrane protein beta-barrel domain
MMSRLFLRAAALGVLAVIGSASDALAQGVGIKFGPTFNAFSSEALDFDNRTGVHGGIFIGGSRENVLGFQTEFNWLRKNVEQHTPALSSIQGGRDIRIDYLQVPVLLRLNAGSRSPNGFAVYGIAGPAIELKVADEIEGLTLDDGFEGADVSLVFGGGFEVARIIVEGRYEKGLRRINKTFSNLDDIKKQAFTILFGIRFN